MNKKLLKNFCAVFLAWFMALLLLPQSAQAQEKKAYVVKSSDQKTLTFYYDDRKSSRTGTVWGIEETQGYVEGSAWSGTWGTPESKVITAVFDASFKNYLPQSTEFWFLNLKKLKKIEGLTNLNTSEVTTMRGMFAGCSRLTSLDLSNFKTEDVKDMSYMFHGCNSLQTIYCNNTWACSESMGMFSGCTNLKGAVPYDASKTNVSMANPETGYFTKKESTGVATATTEANANIQAIYSTDGKRLNELQRGLNIVRMSNGTTQKILRK